MRQNEQQPMPVVFVGHGSPMITQARNVYSKAWARMGKDLPRPKAILAVSAHWYVPGTAVTMTERDPGQGRAVLRTHAGPLPPAPVRGSAPETGRADRLSGGRDRGRSGLDALCPGGMSADSLGTTLSAVTSACVRSAREARSHRSRRTRTGMRPMRSARSQG